MIEVSSPPEYASTTFLIEFLSAIAVHPARRRTRPPRISLSPVLNKGRRSGSSPDDLRRFSRSAADVFVHVHVGITLQNGTPALQERPHHRIARHLMAVEFKRAIGLVFNLDQDLRRIVDVLQHAKARSTHRPV